MYCLTSTCYVCLKTKDKSLVNINSSLSVNKDILHILGYLPCNLGWLKTKALVLICEECCLRLRETYLFLAMCLTNSVVLRGYINKLNTTPGSSADTEVEQPADTEQDEKIEIKCEIKLEPGVIITEETDAAFVNVENYSVQTVSSIKIEPVWDEVNGEEESLIGNSSINSGLGHQQYQSSCESVMVQGKKHKKLNNNEDTFGGSTVAKKAKKNNKQQRRDSVTSMDSDQQQAQQQQQQQQPRESKTQRRARVKMCKLEFRALLAEAHLHCDSTYSAFEQTYGQDERFKNVFKRSSRGGLFGEYIRELRKRDNNECQCEVATALLNDQA